MAAISTFTTRTGDNHLDGLLMGVKYQTPVLTYSFPDYAATPVLDGGDTALATARATYQNAARQQLALFSSYINVTFVEVSGVGETGDLKFSESAEPMEGSAAYAYFPGGPGRVVVSPTYVVDGSGDFYSNYGWMTLLHELGHALGLKHPHSTTGYPYNGTNNFPVLDAAVDATRYTVMSYNNDESVGPDYLFAQTLSVLDIQALQYLYGANTGWNSGNTTYTYNLDTTPYFETIWDGGGTDTLVLNSASALEIDLTPGSVNGPAYEYVLGIAYGAWIENLTTGSGNDRLTGNSLANRLESGNGRDTLDGGLGADTLIGGAGDDTYYTDDAGDSIVEAASAGYDTVYAAASIVLSANVDRVFLTGAGHNNATGNSMYNKLVGNSGNNVLNGGGGLDTLEGGLGDDTFVVDTTTDTLIEAASGGTDTVSASVSFTLAANFENLTLTGTANRNGAGNTLNNVLTGNSGVNTLTGAEGKDTLDGGAGADSLTGGVGDDVYVVDNTGDLVTELFGEGYDSINASINTTLSANVERLYLTGSGHINGTGNSMYNKLYGNSGNNVLNGGGGVDTLEGGLGGDSYYVDSAADVVTELANAGYDSVYAAASVTLSANVERLYLTGSGHINGTGNSMYNKLYGNSGNNVLNGGGGIDTLEGGLGNDTYVVDTTTDVITEAAASGTDTVQSSVSYTLGANLENLTLTGTSNRTGTGNSLNNVLTGNSGANTLTGGLGNDTYVGSRAMGADTVVENDATAGNTDVLSFLSGVAHDQLWFLQSGNNLEVSIIGTADKAVIKDWYVGEANRVEAIRTVDGGKELLSGEVQALVTAMAGLTPPPLGQTSLTVEQQAALEGVLAANWS